MNLEIELSKFLIEIGAWRQKKKLLLQKNKNVLDVSNWYLHPSLQRLQSSPV